MNNQNNFKPINIILLCLVTWVVLAIFSSFLWADSNYEKNRQFQEAEDKRLERIRQDKKLQNRRLEDQRRERARQEEQRYRRELEDRRRDR